MSRAHDEQTIRDTYGAPGEPYATPVSALLAYQIVLRMGLSALTDAAIHRLARLHRETDDREARTTTGNHP